MSRRSRGELRHVSLRYVREGRIIFKSADSTTTGKGWRSELATMKRMFLLVSKVLCIVATMKDVRK
jgi:hypothetical protein